MKLIMNQEWPDDHRFNGALHPALNGNRAFGQQSVGRLVVFALLLVAVALHCPAQIGTSNSAMKRRSLAPADYDIWRSIQSERLSRDGKWVAYVLMPQVGNAELVVRSLASETEYRTPIGTWPRSNSAPSLRWTYDSRFVVVQTCPIAPKLNRDNAADKTTENIPQNGLAIFDTSAGTATRVESASTFQVPELSSRWIAYKPAGSAHTELVLRNIDDGSERKLEDVTDFSFTKDAELLVYAASSKDEARNGVFAFRVGSTGAPTALLRGEGKYSNLTWDTKQTQLAFLAKSKLYLWTRGDATALALTGCVTPGLEPTGSSPIKFSSDGERISFGCAPVSANANGEMHSGASAKFDLWGWNDPELQSIQKLDAIHGRNRAFLTVWNIPTKQLLQIGDKEISTAVLSEDGRWALGIDDHRYLKELDYLGPYGYPGGYLPYAHADIYLINTLTGSRQLLLTKYRGIITFSPDARYVIYFDGRNWNTISTQDGTAINITQHLGVRFDDDSDEYPDIPPPYGSQEWIPYGSPEWTSDSKYVLLYDRYDIWKISPDGKEAQSLTKGIGRRDHMTLRYVRFQPGSPSREIDPQKPMLVRAENEVTHDTGFYQVSIRSANEPRRLIFDKEKFSMPVKADGADVLLLTASTFRKFPDLLVTDPEFRHLRRVSDANPQQKDFLWGTAETISFHDSTGQKLQGILYKPDGFDPKTKYPMIVHIYEHLSDRIHDYFPPRPEWGHAISISYYVSNGYLVLTPDIHYTIGHPGRSALQCVLAAIDTVARKGFVNEKAIGIEGHSWGGSEVSYIIAHTDRFHAAEAGAGIADIISGYDDIRPGSGWVRQWIYERNQDRIGCTLWQCPDLYIENSPIFNIDRVKTPLLMLRDDGDTTASFGMGLELYLALRRLGKEVYMFNYNGEGHDLSKWVDQKDFAIRMQQFFDCHLKGAPMPEWMRHGIPYLESH